MLWCLKDSAKCGHLTSHISASVVVRNNYFLYRLPILYSLLTTQNGLRQQGALQSRITCQLAHWSTSSPGHCLDQCTRKAEIEQGLLTLEIVSTAIISVLSQSSVLYINLSLERCL